MKQILSLLVLTCFAIPAFAQSESVTAVCDLKASAHLGATTVEITFPGTKVSETLNSAVISKAAIPAKISLLGQTEFEVLLSVSYFGFEPNMYKAVGASNKGIFEITYDFWSAQRLVLERRADGEAQKGACRPKAI
ncbi:MAG: hypothetical protein EOP06_23835 [Proteobacteria bacterium]|nr:MAG: hypothetical protein EOP06_23835 [Pseudomonadota bacterium]